MIGRECVLYTLDGELEATIAKEYDDGKYVQVKSKDGTAAIKVYKSLAERKFENDPCPTFFAC